MRASESVQSYVILHPPGTPNDTHYHEHDEWWVVMRGEINCDQMRDQMNRVSLRDQELR